MLDRVQITRLEDSIPRWQIRDLKVSMSELRYALRASEEQIQAAVNLKPGQQMTIDVHLECSVDSKLNALRFNIPACSLRIHASQPSPYHAGSLVNRRAGKAANSSEYLTRRTKPRRLFTNRIPGVTSARSFQDVSASPWPP